LASLPLAIRSNRGSRNWQDTSPQSAHSVASTTNRVLPGIARWPWDCPLAGRWRCTPRAGPPRAIAGISVSVVQLASPEARARRSTCWISTRVSSPLAGWAHAPPCGVGHRRGHDLVRGTRRRHADASICSPMSGITLVAPAPACSRVSQINTVKPPVAVLSPEAKCCRPAADPGWCSDRTRCVHAGDRKGRVAAPTPTRATPV
jgi:hypothetical protein